MESTTKFYAFISYKREDEKWAKWLQEKLEHYRFPKRVKGRDDLPKFIRPTFRDVTDLNPGLLSQEIDNALINSEWLIVICSPRSAKSQWVGKEAQTFIDLGRADHIIPFVIEGTPFDPDPDKRCYPEALLSLTGKNELLGANINEMGREAAYIKVVSRMFGLRFDMLWQRHERQKRKRRRIISLAAIAVICAVVSVALVFRQQKRQLQLSQSQMIADKAEELINAGDSYLAQLLLLEVLPDGSFDHRPYSFEADMALRNALEHASYKLPYSDIGGYDLKISDDNQYIIGHSRSDTVYVWKSSNGDLVKKYYQKTETPVAKKTAKNKPHDALEWLEENDYEQNSDWKINNIYYNNDETKMVVNSSMTWGRNEGLQKWTLYDLQLSEQEPIVSYSPILFNKSGGVIYNAAERPKDLDYVVLCEDKKFNDQCVPTKTLDFNDEILNIQNADCQYILTNDDEDRFIDASTLQEVEREKYYKGKMLNYSANKQYFATFDNESVLIYKEDSCLMSLSAKGLPQIEYAEIGSDGSYLLTKHNEFDSQAVMNSVFYLWDLKSGNKKLYQRFDDDLTIEMHFNYKGDKVYVSTGEIKSLRHNTSWMLQLDLLNNPIEKIYSSPLGSYIVTWSELEVALWDATTYRLIWKKSLGESFSAVYDARIDNTEKLMLIALRDRTLLFDVASGKLIKHFDYYNSCVSGENNYAVFTPDSKRVFFVSFGGCFMYEIPTVDDIINIARMNLEGRKLSITERKKYHLEKIF